MKQELAQLGNGAHALAIQILGNRDDAADAVHDAFAAVLDVAPGTVMSRLHRARMALKTELETIDE